MLILNNISKTYEVGDQKVTALDRISLSIEKGKFTIILGPSGSGKSTILNILGGMDKASSGSFIFDGVEIARYNEKELSTYRRDLVGFVFQFYNLIPTLTAKENVAIAAKLTNNDSDSDNYLEKVGLGQRKNSFPTQMSGGEMQRVAIARALAKRPQILLCDEPTGALDSDTGESIVSILKEISQTTQTAVIMVTHNGDFASLADRLIYLRDGKISEIVDK